MRRIVFILFLLLILVMLTACSTVVAVPEEEPLPTLFPTHTPQVDLEAAQRVSLAYLDAWQRQDFGTMYSLLTFSSQDIITLEEFRAIYEDAQNTITMRSLTFAGRGFARMGSRMAQLVYDVTFNTNILGTFSDTNRTLTVLIDPQFGDWRVAWSTGDIFPEMANGARLEFTSQTPSRANIYDRNGVVLADNNQVYVTVQVIPQNIPEYDACVTALADSLNVSSERIEQIFDAGQPDWIIDVGQIEPAIYTARNAELDKTCAANFVSFPIRSYTDGDLAPHIVGHVGYPTAEELPEIIRQGFNAETMIGRAGVERSWNDILNGIPGGTLSLVSSSGERLRILAEAAPQSSQSIWLTIDTRLQAYVQQALRDAYEGNNTYIGDQPAWGATSPGASAIVFEVNTGEVLAMVSHPDYDANAFTPFPLMGREAAADEQQRVINDSRTPMLNRPAQGAYPSGSVFKVVDAVAIQDSGIYDAAQDYYCSGFWEHEDDYRTDWIAGGHGRVTTRSALAQSCNPFFYETGFLLNQADPNLLPSYARRMGLGNLTGIDDVSEAAGLIHDPQIIREQYGRAWTYSDAVNLSIGQGEVQVTPLQMVRMYAGIANGGALMRPHLVREHGILSERTFVAEPDIMSSFDVAPEALDLVRQGLCDVTVQRYGTAWHIFNLPNESPMMDLGVCAKTGTAQAPGANALPHSWFAAYAPAGAPEIAVVVMVENAGDGSAVAAPITKFIMEYYFFLMDEE